MNMLRQAMQKSYELIEEDTASTSRWLKKHSNHIWAKEGILSFFFFVPTVAAVQKLDIWQKIKQTLDKQQLLYQILTVRSMVMTQSYVFTQCNHTNSRSNCSSKSKYKNTSYIR